MYSTIIIIPIHSAAVSHLSLLSYFINNLRSASNDDDINSSRTYRPTSTNLASEFLTNYSRIITERMVVLYSSVFGARITVDSTDVSSHDGLAPGDSIGARYCGSVAQNKIGRALPQVWSFSSCAFRPTTSCHVK